MNEMKADAGIETPRITPYSSRKRLLTRLAGENIPVNQIIHKHVHSVNKYSKISDKQSKTISDIISNKENTNLEIQVRPDGAASLNQQGQGPSGMFSHGMFSNSHVHGPVSFDFSNTSMSENQTLSQMSAVHYNQCSPTRPSSNVESPMVRPAYKRIRVESDDSD